MRWIIAIFAFFILFIGRSNAQDPSEREYELIAAAEKGETAKVVEFLNDSLNPDVRDWYGMTPLHYASQNGHISTVKSLVLNGASVDLSEEEGRTALNLAVHFNQLEIAEFLVQNNADINAKDAYGISPLFYAAAYGDYLMTDMFLFYSEGKSTRDPDGRTPFLAAVLGGHITTASLLLKYFADVNETDNEGNNAVHLAILNDDIEMIDSLFSWGCDINAVNQNGYSCLDQAIQENSPLAAQKLISLGAEVNHNIRKGINSLDLALLSGGNPEITDFMEAAGAKRNKRPSFSQPAISLKINSGFIDAFSTLQMELWEPKYGIGINLGISQRMGRLKVLTPPENNIRYQFRETRTGFLGGIQKQWIILRIDRNNRVGIHTGFDMAYFMGNYKARELAPDKFWVPIPSAGLYWRTGAWQMSLAGLHQNMKTYQLPSLRFGISVSYRFNELN